MRTMMLGLKISARGFSRLICGGLAVGGFAVFTAAALQDRTATASAAAALSLAFMVLAALDLESFEALGIKAKLRDTLDDAQAKVRNLDKVIRVLAASTFVQSARGDLTNEERRAMVADMSDALAASGVSLDEIERLKRPFYAYIALVLWYAFGAIRARYTQDYLRHVQTRLGGVKDPEEKIFLEAENQRFKIEPNSEYPVADNVMNFRALLEKSIAVTPTINERDRTVFGLIADDLMKLFDGCIQRGNLSPEMMSLSHELTDFDSSYKDKQRARLTVPAHVPEP